MFRAVSRIIVAAAAGAGLGAGAALARRRSAHAFEHPDGPGEFVPASPSADEASETAVIDDAAERMSSQITALAASVAELEEARRRLRLRAAELRAEMDTPPNPD